MKTGTVRFYHGVLALCLCFVLAPFAGRCQPTFGGITANSYVNFYGNVVTMDSFNSADPNHSIWQTGMTYHGTPYGVYSDVLSYNSNSFPSRTVDFTLAADSIINVGYANVYGYVDTGAGGDADIDENGSVGDLNWVYNGMAGIELGHAETNMNVLFYSKTLPRPTNSWLPGWLSIPSPLRGGIIRIGGTWTNSSEGWTCVGGTLYTNYGSGFYLPSSTGSYAYYSQVITNRPENTNYAYYAISQLNQNLFVDAPNVVLYSTNGINFPPASHFTLNTNADIQIYVTGNIDFSGATTTANQTQYARALSIYDVAGYTNLSFGFSGSFGPAFIYAPNSSVTFSSGGSAPTVIGAIYCNNLSVSGNYHFHFDESLSTESLLIPPWIIQQPADQIVQVGSNATFNVVVGGATGPYQWFFSQGGANNPIYGATNTSLTITNVQPANAGSYSVETWNPYGSVTTSLASLIVYTNAAATLSGAFNAANGQFQMLVQNTSAVGGRMPYILQASTNLTDWVPILTNGTPFVYTETNTFPQRYYRAVFNP